MRYSMFLWETLLRMKYPTRVCIRIVHGAGGFSTTYIYVSSERVNPHIYFHLTQHHFAFHPLFSVVCFSFFFLLFSFFFNSATVTVHTYVCSGCCTYNILHRKQKRERHHSTISPYSSLTVVVVTILVVVILMIRSLFVCVVYICSAGLCTDE